jgi:hypothetical protein
MSNSFKIRNYIKAKSEKRLRSLMFHKQLELKMAALEFDNITHAKGYWYAWYYEIASDAAVIAIESDTNGNTKDN